jgi:hypothetical protein
MEAPLEAPALAPRWIDPQRARPDRSVPAWMLPWRQSCAPGIVLLVPLRPFPPLHPPCEDPMRRILIVGCLGTVAACGPTTQTSAPGTRPATPAAADVETVVGTSNALSLVRDSDIASHPLAAGPEVLWGRLVEQFDELELPVTAFATSSRVIGTQHERLRRIGRQPVSRFFECPGTAFGNTASTEFLAVTVVAQLASRAEGGSDLRLVASATTRPRSGGEVRCRSTGQLERRIRQALEEASRCTVSLRRMCPVR